MFEEAKYIIRKDIMDLRDKVYQATQFIREEHLPESVDLRSKMSPVCDQGDLGSCTANSIVAGLREYLLLQSGQPFTRLSRLYLYWHERALENSINEDSGAMLRDGMKVLTKFGVPAENDYPYDVRHFTDTPSKVAETDATKYKITTYHRVPSLLTLKAALAEGSPVVFSMQIYDSFESDEVANTGMIPYPQENEQCLGGHAMCFVGYKKINNKEYLIVRNSWGEDWGDKGYCYIPSDFIYQEFFMDMWTGK